MKTSDIHLEIEEWMAGALCGGLSAQEQELFDRHIAECDACRALYKEEQLMSKILEKEMAALRPEPEFGEAMVSRFRERVGTTRRGLEWLGTLARLALSRPAQVVYAVLVLAAMVETGSMITGESSPYAVRPMQGMQAPGGVARALAAQQAQVVDQFQMPSKAAGDAFGFKDEAPPVIAAPVSAAKALQAATTLDSEGAAPGADSLGTVTRNPDRPFKEAYIASAVAPAAPSIPSAMVTQLGNMTTDRDASKADKSEADTTAPTPEDQRKLIRNASVQYEVGDYTKAADTLNGLIAEEGGYLSTQNSERGANGKLAGTIEVKLPPEHLDGFLMKLHVLGDLKSQSVTTQDVTKEYFDTDARMHNAQVEEQRLQEILSKDTGKLNEILQVERELARVRQNIEEMQGTLKYYNTMAQYATVTIDLSEKDLTAPAQFLLKQRSDLSIFAADVEGTFARAKDVATAAKAQILDSNVERNQGGQTTATLSLLIAPEAAESTIAQLKGLGRIQTFTSSTQRVAQDGSGSSDTARTDRDKVEVHLTVLEDQERPAQQAAVSVLAADVEARLGELKTKATGLGALVTGANFQRDASGTEAGTVQLRMPLRDYDAVLAAVKSLGDVKSLSVNRQEGTTTGDNAPAEMSVTIYSRPGIVPDDNGVWATFRRTIGEAFGAAMWSVRMIGVSLAFFAPWVVALVLVVLGVKVARRRKSE